VEGEYDVWCCVGTAATALPCWAVAFSPTNVAGGFPPESQTALCRGDGVHSNNPGEADALSDPRLMTVVDRETSGIIFYVFVDTVFKDLNAVFWIMIGSDLHNFAGSGSASRSCRSGSVSMPDL